MNDIPHKNLLRAEFPVPENINQIRNIAWADLMYGPYGAQNIEGCDYPGFDKALDALQSWCDQNVFEVWADGDFLYTSEPEGYEDETGEYIEPFWEEIYHYERKDVIVALFGKEVAEYLT